MAWSTSPEMPLPPIPMTTTFSMSSRFGRPVMPLEPGKCFCYLLGERRGQLEHPIGVENFVLSGGQLSLLLVGSFEIGLHAVGGSLCHQPLVLGVVNVLGVLDEHVRDAIFDEVPTSQARVVEGILVSEVQERPFVLRAGEDLDEQRVKGHGYDTPLISESTIWV